MNFLFNRRTYRFARLLLCTILFQQHLFAQVEIFIVPNMDKSDTFTKMEPAARRWFDLNRKSDDKEDQKTYKGCKRSESGSSVIVITQRTWVNRAGEGGADKPERVTDDPSEESSSIQIETIESLGKVAEKPAAVIKESLSIGAKGGKDKVAEKPAVVKKTPGNNAEDFKIKRTNTVASNKPDEMATARGKSDLEMSGRTNISPENLRSLENERPAADAMAKAGYDVEFTEGKITGAERAAEGLRATANPDLRVEGKLMDIYSPSRNSNPVSAAENVFSKVRDAAGAQTRRVVVSLDDSSISRTQFQDALRRMIQEYGDYGMQEIFAVQKGKVYKMYPF